MIPSRNIKIKKALFFRMGSKNSPKMLTTMLSFRFLITSIDFAREITDYFRNGQTCGLKLYILQGLTVQMLLFYHHCYVGRYQAAHTFPLLNPLPDLGATDFDEGCFRNPDSRNGCWVLGAGCWRILET